MLYPNPNEPTNTGAAGDVVQSTAQDEIAMPQDMGDITRLLHEWRAGSRKAENQLFELVYPKLRHFARRYMNGERKGHSLQSADLVNQSFISLVAAKDRWRNRQHFFAYAGRAMRNCLIDYWRRRPHVKFDFIDNMREFLPARGTNLDVTITVNRALDELAQFNPEWCSIVEVKVFLQLTDEEAAEALGIPLRTLQRRWSDARQWLLERLSSGNGRKAAAQ